MPAKLDRPDNKPAQPRTPADLFGEYVAKYMVRKILSKPPAQPTGAIKSTQPIHH